jgi:hypothetical protein
LLPGIVGAVVRVVDLEPGDAFGGGASASAGGQSFIVYAPGLVGGVDRQHSSGVDNAGVDPLLGNH